jgi:hypothetical protein
MNGGTFLTAALACALLPAAGAADVPRVGRYEVFEFTMESAEAFANPFAEARMSAEFRGPDGRRIAVAGFYYGGNKWVVRFAPPAAGRWTVRARLAGKKGATERAGAFECAASARRGFLRISKRNPYRLEWDDGTPFYPVGIQTCGLLQTGMDGPAADGSWRTVPIETWMQAFAGATNLTRWQLGAGTKAGCAWPVIPVDGAPDRYDTELAEKIDRILAAQRAHGAAQILVPFQDMSLGSRDKTAFGAVQDVTGYKSLKAANLPLQEAYLRYIVARWGAYVDIWELFNEDGSAPVDYLARLAATVREADPYRHPITTNYTRSGEPWCEIATWHGYVRMPAAGVDEWIAAMVGRYKSYGKPVLNTEFGNKGTLSNVDPVKWRVAVWSAFMSESNVLFWDMSGRKTEPRDTQSNSNAYLGADSRQHFRVFHEFTRGLPVDLRPVEASYTWHGDVRVYALSNGRTGVLYVHHFADHARPYQRKERDYIQMGPGRFRLTWVDPGDGRVVKTDMRETAQPYLFFETPPVTVDLACRVERED